MRRFATTYSFTCLLVGLAACGSDRPPAAAGKDAVIKVAVAFYPVEEMVSNVGGSAVQVINLTPPGGSPHSVELTGKQVTELGQADVVFYVGRGFQPTVEKAVSALGAKVVKVDLLNSVPLLLVTAQLAGTAGEVDGEVLEGNTDPHIWVDPTNMMAMTKVIETTLAAALPSEKAVFAKNALTYTGKLTALDGKFSTQLKSCQSRTIVTSHRAFEYMAKRYDLKQIPIAGISPDEEPDPKSLEAVAAAAKADAVTTVFFEEQVPRGLSETVASEIGATTDALDPIETITREDLASGTTYVSIQETNLASLVKGLRCA
jgi:zinc transport system substrate-binding protein